MKKVLIFFLVVFCGNLFSQSEMKTQQKRDSLEIYLNSNRKSKTYLKHLHRAVELAKEIEDDSLIMHTNVTFGLQSFFKNDTNGLTIAQNNLGQLYVKTKDSFALAKKHHYKALIHLINVTLDSSIYYYHQSKNISILIKDSLEVGRRLLSMSNVLYKANDFIGSEIAAVEGVRFLEPIKDTRYLESLYVGVGMALNGTGNQNKARTYYKKALEVNKNNPSKSRRESSGLNILNNIGKSYNSEKKYNKAIPYFLEGLNFNDIETKYPSQFVVLLGNLSYSYLMLGKKEEALKGYYKVLKTREERNFSFGVAISHDLLANYFLEENKKVKALYHTFKTLEFAKKSRNIIRELNAYANLSKLEKPEKARMYFNKHIQLKDSLIRNERLLKNQFARIRYETGKKEQENDTLKIENEKKQLELEQEKQQKIIGFLIALGSLFFLGLCLFFFKNRKKKMAIEAQLQKIEARDEERQQIAKSLHDEVAGDLNLLHQQLEKSDQETMAKRLSMVKNNVRDLSHQLSSIRFEEVSFKDQLINLISDYYTTQCKITIEGLKEFNWIGVNNPIKRTLYLCIRECLQNVKKHAKASQVSVVLQLDKSYVALLIKDNGIGFSTIAKGIGLKNLKERVEELNGTVQITSTPNEGTSLQINIPVYA